MFESQMMNSVAVLGSILESKKRDTEPSRRWDEPELAPIRSFCKQELFLSDPRTLSVFQTNPGKLAANTKCVENC